MSTEYNNFIGPFAGSVKEPIFAFIPRVGTVPPLFPSVVLETGWNQPGPRVQQIRQLWLEGTGYETRVVLVLEFSLPNTQNQVYVHLDIWRAQPGQPATHMLYVSKYLCTSIDHFTNYQ
jgi:hypothetical protein